MYVMEVVELAPAHRRRDEGRAKRNMSRDEQTTIVGDFYSALGVLACLPLYRDLKN